MKRAVLGIFLITGMSSLITPVFAFDDIGPLGKMSVPGTTYFEKIGNLLEKATKPNPKEISGKFWSGRCFAHSQPSLPRGCAFFMTHSSSSTAKDMKELFYGTEVSNGYGGSAFCRNEISSTNYSVPQYYDAANWWEAFKSLKEAPLQQIVETETSLSYWLRDEVPHEIKVAENLILLESKPIPEETSWRCYFFHHNQTEQEFDERQ